MDKQKELDMIDGLIKTMTAANEKMLPFGDECLIRLYLGEPGLIRKALQYYREKVADE